jgi:RNA polymerase sigma factor (sigma-70 family)
MTLGDRELRVITLRFGLNGEGPLTLRQAGRRLGISRERVRQLEHRTLIKLKQMI